MKYLIILCTFLFNLGTNAHTIKGKIAGLKEGSTVYLSTHPDHKIERKWVLSQRVDSAIVKNGMFEFNVPNSPHGRLWQLRGDSNYLKYYFNKDENITFEGRALLFGLVGENITGGHDRILLEDIFSILDNDMLTPIGRRAGVEWLKRHASEDVGLFATAYFYLIDRVLKDGDIQEILETVPIDKQNLPYYKQIRDAYKQNRSVQATKLNESFIINGYVEGILDGIAELVLPKKGTLRVPEIVDSAIIENGYFTFCGQVPFPQYCNVGIRGTNHPVGFYLENSPIELNIKIRQDTYKQNGKEISSKSLQGRVYGSHSEKETRYISALRDQQDIENWISNHPSNMPTLMMLATQWSETYSPDQLEKWLNMMDPNLSNRLAYKEVLKQITKHRELAIGASAPEFSLPSDKEKKISLKDFRGKFVLLDFWASWCGPCRGEIPNLKKAWANFHRKGFEIISITIDKNEQAWRKALADEQMPWTQLNGKGSKIQEQYNIQGIPHILLINPAGKIVGINLRGEKLEKKLQELLSH